MAQVALTPEQEKILILARARVRLQQQQGRQQEPDRPQAPPAHGFGESGTSTYTREMTPDQLDNELTLQRLEQLGVDPSSPIFGTLKNYGKGILNFLDNPVTNAVALPFDMAVAGAKGGYNAVSGLMEGGDAGWQRAARGSADFAANAVPAGAILGDAARTGIRAVQRSGPMQAASQRLTNSYLDTNKRSFEFGRDPVAEVAKLPPSLTYRHLADRIAEKLGTNEHRMTQLLREHADTAEHLGTGGGIDVGPELHEAIQPSIERALRDESPAVARRIRGSLENRIAEIKQKYGSTYLTPGQIWAEKQLLADEVSFKTDSVALNLNEAKQNMYSRLDHAFDTLVGSEGAELNHSSSGLIEAKKIVGETIRQNSKAPFLSRKGGVLETVVSKFPEVLPKSLANAALRGPVTRSSGAGMFFPAPVAAPESLVGNYGKTRGRIPAGEAYTGDLGHLGPPAPPPVLDQFGSPSGVAPRTGVPNVQEARPPVNQFGSPSGVSPRGPLPNIFEAAPEPPPRPPLDQFASPSGVSPRGPLPSAMDVKPGAMNQFENPSGVSPRTALPHAPEVGPRPPQGYEGFSGGKSTGTPTRPAGPAPAPEIVRQGDMLYQRDPATGTLRPHALLDPYTGKVRMYLTPGPPP